MAVWYPTRRPPRLAPAVLAVLRQARHELRDGAPRAPLWLERIHRIHVSASAIQHVCRELGVPRVKRARKRAPRQRPRFEKPEPGDSVQVDVKVVSIPGRKVYQSPAIDDCTQDRVLRLYRRLTQHASGDFLAQVRRHLPLAIHQLQPDNGREFPSAFALNAQAAGSLHRHIQLRRPQQNGKVERSIRIDSEELWGRAWLPDFATAVPALQAWERTGTHDRFSLALRGLTPAEKLAAKLPRRNQVAEPLPVGQPSVSELLAQLETA